MILDATYPTNYEIEYNVDLPGGSSEVRHFAKDSDSPLGRVALICEFHPRSGRAWFGSFGQGYSSDKVVTAAYSTPDPEVVCIVSAGAGFFIRVSDPDKYICVRTFPILSVTPLASHRLLLFSDFTTLSAFACKGLAWETEPLCSDDLRLVKVDGDVIQCTGWDAITQSSWEHVVNVSTGRLIDSREI